MMMMMQFKARRRADLALVCLVGFIAGLSGYVYGIRTNRCGCGLSDLVSLGKDSLPSITFAVAKYAQKAEEETICLARQPLHARTAEAVAFKQTARHLNPQIAAFLLKFREKNAWREYPEHFVSAIVNHEHKLIMCTIPKVACTSWRKMLRRLNGADDWATTDERITHGTDGMSSGLTYLDEYSDKEANRLMNEPSYTKVVVVRNPLTRLLSGWKDKFGPGGPHSWGNVPWPDFVKAKVKSGCLEKHDGMLVNEHFIPQSCFCGMRKWRYDIVAQMEADMLTLPDRLVELGILPAEIVQSGWGKSGQERFLASNDAFHKTGADEKLAEYYSPHKFPGVLDHILNTRQEDLVRFDYTEAARAIETLAQAQQT